ncbi:MAG: putative NAD-dependent protein deacetylase HST1, partial [Streblomastix strix]
FYSKLKKKGLGRPEDIFTLSTFLQDPSIYYSNSADLCPTNYIPSPTHFFFAKLEAEGKLLRVFTQNIDDLEAKAGVSRLVQCHGSMGSAACMQCHHEVPIETIEEELRAGEIAYCRVCDKNKREKRGVYKPDVVFFGENLPKRFFDLSSLEMPLADMVIVVGTALAVHPVADLPGMVSNVDETPQVLINREVVGTAGWFDAHLLGNSDDAIIELVKAMGWEGEVPISLEDRRWATEEIGKLRNEERNRLSGGDKEEQ